MAAIANNPFPFYLKTVQPDRFQEQTGLTSEEADQIDRYVQEKLPMWSESIQFEFGTVRIAKEESHLPRTIQVFRAYDRLCVQVLCKTKGGLSPVGEGFYKRGKIAVEWKTKTLWVQYVSKPHPNHSRERSLYYAGRIFQGIASHRKIERRPGIFPKPVGVSSDFNYQKISYFGPLRDGDGEKLQDITTQELSHITREMLQSLYVLEENNLVHNDLYKRNILFHRDNQGELHLELTDFDKVEERPDGLAERRESGMVNDLESDDLSCMYAILKSLAFNLPGSESILQAIERLAQKTCSARQILSDFDRFTQ